MTADWRGPFWLKPLLGSAQDSIFHRVTSVDLRGRHVPDALLEFKYLREVSLFGCSIDPARLQQLRGLNSIESLTLEKNHLNRTEVTPVPPALPTPAAPIVVFPPVIEVRGPLCLADPAIETLHCASTPEK